MKQIDLVYGTAFAELAQRTFDAQFQADFPSKVGLLRFRSCDPDLAKDAAGAFMVVDVADLQHASDL